MLQGRSGRGSQRACTSVVGAAWRAGCSARERREGRKERGREKKKRKRKKEKGKRKGEGKRKRGRERQKRDRSADSAAAIAAGRARAPIGRGARDEEEQGDRTVVGYRDQVFGRSRDRAGNDFEWTVLND